MQTQDFYGKLLTVKDGYLECPNCHRNRRLKRVAPDEVGERILLYCRDCKTEIRIDIVKGKCFESRGR